MNIICSEIELMIYLFELPCLSFFFFFYLEYNFKERIMIMFDSGKLL